MHVPIGCMDDYEFISMLLTVVKDSDLLQLDTFDFEIKFLHIVNFYLDLWDNMHPLIIPHKLMVVELLEDFLKFINII